MPSASLWAYSAEKLFLMIAKQPDRGCAAMKAPVGLLSRRPVCEANATTCYDPLPVKKQSRNDRSHSGFAIYKNNNSAVYGAAHAEPF